MSDDDLQARVVSSEGYAWRPDGPITAFVVSLDGEVRSYVWFADDGSQEGAGVVSIPSAGPAAAAEAVALSGRLRASRKTGTTARDAVHALHGPAGPEPSAGIVSTSPLSFPDVHALRRAARTTSGSGQEPVPADVGQADLDAALRAGRVTDPAIAREIDALDRALEARPTPEALSVWVGDPSVYGDQLPEAGSRATEATYLRAGLLTDTTEFGSADTVLVLRVPPGVPALWLDSNDPAGTMLLARGRTWSVDGVERSDRRALIRATMLP